jgi:hypothetical protein
VFLSSVAFSYAQDIDQAKEIDAEKYQNAKSLLKSIIKSDPTKVLLTFWNVYLTQRVVDSAKLLSKWLKSQR